jgi:hypothetical protein
VLAGAVTLALAGSAGIEIAAALTFSTGVIAALVLRTLPRSTVSWRLRSGWPRRAHPPALGSGGGRRGDRDLHRQNGTLTQNVLTVIDSK